MLLELLGISILNDFKTRFQSCSIEMIRMNKKLFLFAPLLLVALSTVALPVAVAQIQGLQPVFAYGLGWAKIGRTFFIDCKAELAVGWPYLGNLMITLYIPKDNLWMVWAITDVKECGSLMVIKGTPYGSTPLEILNQFGCITVMIYQHSPFVVKAFGNCFSFTGMASTAG
jgi:hypothetical protein